MTTQHPISDTSNTTDFQIDLSGRYRIDLLFAIATWSAIAIAILVLVTLLLSVLIEGFPRLSWVF
jgi:phosphate transport system permease protein